MAWWLCLLLCCFGVAVRSQSRSLITGQPCAFPFVYEGTVYTDCLVVDGREWCSDADGNFGVCATDAAPTPTPETPNESSSPRGSASRVTDGAATCCRALEEIGFDISLPVFVIDSEGVEIPDEPKVKGTLCVCAADQDERHVVGVEIRGSTSARDFAKKSFAVETRDGEDQDKDVSLLGFPEESDWILYGPEMDGTMGMRNYLTMELYRATGRYASRVQFCEVFVVQDGRRLDLRHYNGIYVLMEKIKRGGDRVPIDAFNADDDISGGYVFKYDNNNIDPGDKVFESTTSGLTFIVTYPAKASVEQGSLDYLSTYIGSVESALGTEDRSSWSEFIDEGSFIDMFLLTELTKNPDGYRGSTYFHKGVGDVLFAGPPWDFNEAYGLCCGYPIEGYLDGGVSNGISGGSAISTNGWRYNICVQQHRCQVDPTDGVSDWFQTLMEDPEFEGGVRSRWAELRRGPWSTGKVRGVFASVREEIADAVQRNSERWSGERSWEAEMDRVEAWTVARLEWMDEVLSAAVSPAG